MGYTLMIGSDFSTSLLVIGLKLVGHFMLVSVVFRLSNILHLIRISLVLRHALQRCGPGNVDSQVLLVTKILIYPA